VTKLLINNCKALRQKSIAVFPYFSINISCFLINQYIISTSVYRDKNMQPKFNFRTRIWYRNMRSKSNKIFDLSLRLTSTVRIRKTRYNRTAIGHLLDRHINIVFASAEGFRPEGISVLSPNIG
jgi:hypothetical protein